MRIRRRIADLPGPGPALRALGGCGLALALALGGVGALTFGTLTFGTLTLGDLPTAWAKGGGIAPRDYDVYRQELVNWKAEGQIQLVLDKLVGSSRSGHADAYGKIVGKVLTDAPLTVGMDPARRRTLFAALIAHLVKDQPEDDTSDILLAPSFLPLLAEDKALVEELIQTRFHRDPISKRRTGFKRLLMRARTALTSTDAGIRGGGIRLLSYSDGVDKAESLAAIHAALGTTRSLSSEDAARYLDAVERLLGYRFENVNELNKFLNAMRGSLGTPDARSNWTDADRFRALAGLEAACVTRLRTRGGAEESKARQAALLYGRALIQRAKAPADFRIFFSEGEPRLSVLQREAIEAARRLEPKATEAWASLLGAALRESDDQAVLEGVAGILSRRFGERPDDGTPLLAAVAALAETVAARLQAGVGTDRLDLRQKLADVLGHVGTARLVQDVLQARENGVDDSTAEAQRAVWAQLIRALGMVRDGLVATLKPHYQRAGSARPEWERLAVAETLGQEGFRITPKTPANREAPQAALFLMHIVHGWPGKAIALEPATADGVGRVVLFVGAPELASEKAKAALAAGTVVLAFDEATPDGSNAVREAAVNSLNFHPGAWTAKALYLAAAENGDVGAAALSTLSLQLGRADIDAAQALAEFIRSRPGEERLLAALDVILARKTPAGNVARQSLAQAVTGLLKPSEDAPAVSEAVRRKAAEVAAKLHDVTALQPIYLSWHRLAPEDAAGRAVWFKLLGELVRAVAQAGASNEPLLEGLATKFAALVTADLENAGALVEILAGLPNPGWRLKRLQAELASAYVGIRKGRTVDQRRGELDRVIVLYGELVKETPGEAGKFDMHAQLYDALHRRWTQLLKTGEQPENPVTFQLAALVAAAASGPGVTAQRAQESEGAELKAAADLTKEQAAQRDRLLKRVDALVAKRKAARKAPPKAAPKKKKPDAPKK